MYTEFYNMKEKPFNLTPSPRFLYLGENHKEALSLLSYGILEKKGFVLLTGEVGTGKTTIVRALIESLNSGIQCAYMSNPPLSPNDLFDFLAFSAFKRKIGIQSKSDFLTEFEGHLKQCRQHQRNFVLIVDEAQNLSFEVLEEIRMISNMETADEKLINIFLVGQPELNEKLNSSRCRPLRQRISVRYHIAPFNLEDTGRYIVSRLKVAGTKNAGDFFSKKVISATHQYSEGIPRLINVLLDNALLLGYARKTRKITPAMIRECYDEIRPDKGVRATESKKDSVSESAYGPGFFRSVFNRWRTVSILAAVAAAAVATAGMQGILSRMWNSAAVLPPVVEQEPPKEENPGVVEKDHDPEIFYQAAPVETGSEPQVEEPQTIDPEDLSSILGLKESDYLLHEQDRVAVAAVVVKRGDTLGVLVEKAYGRVNDEIMRHVCTHNPEISNVNHIVVGQKIHFPPLPGSETGSEYTVHIASLQSLELSQKIFTKLIREGYEAYLLPVISGEKGKFYRISLGRFADYKDAELYVSKTLDEATARYAKIIALDMD